MDNKEIWNKEIWAEILYGILACLDGPPDEPYENLPEETKAFYEKLAEQFVQEKPE
ncbi:MAG: hypothetical protein IJ526_01350 [Lachnospiraceae bacterium]|nr:hypothetical protein [Lachnospiraceae bacterium]